MVPAPQEQNRVGLEDLRHAAGRPRPANNLIFHLNPRRQIWLRREGFSNGAQKPDSPWTVHPRITSQDMKIRCPFPVGPDDQLEISSRELLSNLFAGGYERCVQHWIETFVRGTLRRANDQDLGTLCHVRCSVSCPDVP